MIASFKLTNMNVHDKLDKEDVFKKREVITDEKADISPGIKESECKTNIDDNNNRKLESRGEAEFRNDFIHLEKPEKKDTVQDNGVSVCNRRLHKSIYIT